jgi:hypothetical protein
MNIYPKAKERFLTQGTDLSAASVWGWVVNLSYEYSAEHEFITEVTTPGAAITDGFELTGITVTGGDVTADDLTGLGYTLTSEYIRGIVTYIDTGDFDTSWLLGFYDRNSVGDLFGVDYFSDPDPFDITWSGGTLFSIQRST